MSAMRMNRVLKLPAVLLIFLVSWGGSCDHTVLRGAIVPERPVVRVGETVGLELKLPAELEGVHRIFWRIDTRGAGVLRMERGGEPDSIGVPWDDSRKAFKVFFTAVKPGPCVISVSGFYKQTNPQPITKIEIEVTE